MKKIKYLGLALTAAFTFSCGPSTTILSSFKAPDVTTLHYKKVFVSSLTEKPSVKQTVENSVSIGLNNRGIATVKSIDAFPPGLHTSNKDSILQIIRATGCDGILTIALVKKEKETTYVPGSGGYYGTFGAYYGYGYNSFYSPGYYTEDKIYYVQTNFYDTKTEKLEWAAESKTTNPESLESFLDGYKKAVADQAIKDGVIQPTAK
jgi:hypothetical protein